MRSKSFHIGDLCIRDVISVQRETPLSTCAKIMHDDHVGSLVVTDGDGAARKPVGIITDRDITIEAVAFSLDPATMTAGDIMSPHLVTARKDEDLLAVLARMREHGIRRVPVVEANGLLYGMLTADNILELLAEEVDGLVHVVKSEQVRELRTRPAEQMATG
jgi:CBS domain-containing protein